MPMATRECRGSNLTPSTPVTSVREPPTWLALAPGVLGLLWLRRASFASERTTRTGAAPGVLRRI